jgi:hypothetical protein
MKRMSVMSLAGAAVWAAAVTVGGPAAAAPPTTCGVNLAAPQVISAVEQLPPYPGTGWAWSKDPRTFEGNQLLRDPVDGARNRRGCDGQLPGHCVDVPQRHLSRDGDVEGLRLHIVERSTDHR